MKLLTAVLLLAALAAGGCSSPCMDVQKLLCECRFKTQDERARCERDAEEQEKLAPPTADQLNQCEQLIPTCEQQIELGCDTLETPAGERACGIAVR